MTLDLVPNYGLHGWYKQLVSLILLRVFSLILIPAKPREKWKILKPTCSCNRGTLDRQTSVRSVCWFTCVYHLSTSPYFKLFWGGRVDTEYIAWNGVSLPHPLVWNGVSLPHPLVWNGVSLPHPLVWNGVSLPHPLVWNGVSLSHPLVWNGVSLPHPIVFITVCVTMLT